MNLSGKIAFIISNLRHTVITHPPYHTTTDPVNVIGLYPNLLPSELRNLISQNHPTKPPVLSGDDLGEATKHLITYLTQVPNLSLKF